MLESEAKTKWCPLSRVPFTRDSDDSLTSCNRPSSDMSVDTVNIIEKSTKCIGSDCMAWGSNGIGECGLMNNEC